MGEPLFHRSTRQVQITAYGELLAAQARETLGSFDQLFQRHVRRGRDEMAGRVGVTAPRSIGRRFVLPLWPSCSASTRRSCWTCASRTR